MIIIMSEVILPEYGREASERSAYVCADTLRVNNECATGKRASVMSGP